MDGVPEGWKIKSLSELVSFLRRGISPSYNEKGKLTVISQKCIRTSIIDISQARKQDKTYQEEMNIQDTDTVICSTGTGTLGRVGQVFGEYSNTTFDSHVTLVRPIQHRNMIYLAIKSQQSYLMGMGRGSTNQQELYKYIIEGLPILIPAESVAEQFESMASAIHDKITLLNILENRCAEARDRLLPRLMSGELEV